MNMRQYGKSNPPVEGEDCPCDEVGYLVGVG